MREEDITLWN